MHGLAAGLAACRTPVTVLCEGAETGVTRSRAGYEIRSFATRTPGPAFTLARSLVEFLRERASDARPGDTLLVLNGIFHPSVYAMARLLVSLGLPYVVAPHDPYHPAIFAKRAHVKWPYWYLCERRVLRRAAAVQLLDLRHERYLTDLGLRMPVFETSNGIFAADLPPETALAWPLGGPVRLAFLGRIDAHNKGLDLLIDAFASLAGSVDTRLVMRGPDQGDADALLARARRRGVGDRVSIQGPDYTRRSPTILLEHDVCCLPSRFEGFGLAALEAMLAARPILVSRVAGLAPHVQASDCGVVVTADVAGIRAGLEALVARRRDWRAMGLRGRRYALERFDWTAIAAGALGQYQRVVTGRSRRPSPPPRARVRPGGLRHP